jgi:HEAT repeat protein
MTELTYELRSALQSECAHDLEFVLKRRSPEDLRALQNLLSLAPAVKPEQLSTVIALLGRWGDPSSVAAIRDILPKLDESGRITAIDALGRLGTEEALEGVLAYVDDPSPHVRKFVAYALGRSETQRAREALRRIAEMDESEFVRKAASRQLSRGDDASESN